MSTYPPSIPIVEPTSYPSFEPPRQRRSKWKWILLGLAIVLLVLMGTCVQKIRHAGVLSDVVTAQFHARLDAGQFDEITGTAEPDFTKTTEVDTKAFLETVHRKMGSLVSTNRVNVFAQSTNRGQFVVVTYDSVYTEGKARETFTWRKRAEELKLLGYNINSATLVMK